MTTLDIAHLAFLESIRESIINMGGAAAKGNLIRLAGSISRQLPEVEYESLDAWEAALKARTHPMARVEGIAVRDGNLFILPACPFAPSIKTYEDLFQRLPEEYAQIVEEYNKPGKYTADIHVGYGSGVSPFCAIHQPLRSDIGQRIKVGNKRIQVVQLGSKAADGKKAVARELCQFAGVSQEIVEKHLDSGMCVYAVMICDT
jgi:hypothetical protein